MAKAKRLNAVKPLTPEEMEAEMLRLKAEAEAEGLRLPSPSGNYPPTPEAVGTRVSTVDTQRIRSVSTKADTPRIHRVSTAETQGKKRNGMKTKQGDIKVSAYISPKRAKELKDEAKAKHITFSAHLRAILQGKE